MCLPPCSLRSEGRAGRTSKVYTEIQVAEKVAEEGVRVLEGVIDLFLREADVRVVQW